MTISMQIAMPSSRRDGINDLNSQDFPDFMPVKAAGLDVPDGVRAMPRLIASGSNRPPAPEIENVRLRSPDGFGIPVDVFSEEQVVRYSTASAMIAEDIETRLATNPDLRVIVMGEAHSSTAQSVFDFLAYYLFTGDSGRDFVLALEAFTTPYVNDLIDQLYDGVIEPDEFLARASVDMHLRYLGALAHHEDELGEAVEDPATIDTWRDALERDVIRHFNNDRRVALIDTNRYAFEDEGGRRADRTAGMEQSLFRLAEEHPDSVILAQIGNLHVLPEFVAKPDIAENGPVTFGVPVGRIPGEQPLIPALTEELGEENVHFYIGSEYHELGEQHGVDAEYLGKPTLPDMDPRPDREYDINATEQRMSEIGNCPPGEEACWRFGDHPSATYYLFHHPYFDPKGRDADDIPTFDGEHPD